MLVMDNLLTNINWSAIEIERFFDGHDSAIDAGAISARGSK